MDAIYHMVLDRILVHTSKSNKYPTFEELRKATRLRPAQLLYYLRENISDNRTEIIATSEGRVYAPVIEVRLKFDI